MVHPTKSLLHSGGTRRLLEEDVSVLALIPANQLSCSFVGQVPSDLLRPSLPPSLSCFRAFNPARTEGRTADLGLRIIHVS